MSRNEKTLYLFHSLINDRSCIGELSNTSNKANVFLKCWRKHELDLRNHQKASNILTKETFPTLKMY